MAEAVAEAEEAEAFLERGSLVTIVKKTPVNKIWSVQMVARASMSAVRIGSITATTRRAKRQGPCAGAWMMEAVSATQRAVLTLRATYMRRATV